MTDDTTALTIDEYCRAYRISRETAYREIRGGRLLARKLGRKTIILRDDARAWAAALPALQTSNVA